VKFAPINYKVVLSLVDVRLKHKINFCKELLKFKFVI